MTDRTVPTEPALVFTYRNWRGEVSTRRVRPMGIRFGSTEWHPEAQWLMRALDIDKGEEREFAMKDIAASPAAPGAEVEPVAEWEMFRDESHFGMWCVRPKGSRAFGDGFHVVDKAEGQRLLTALNPPTTDAIRAQARREALEQAMAAALSSKMEWERKAAEPGRSDHDVAVFESAASAAAEIHADIQRLAGKPGEAEGWRPIATAPKDGTPVLVAITGGKNGDTVSEAYWHVKDANWWFASTSPDQYIFDPISDCMFGEISHWQPLPAPPSAQGGGDGE